MTLTLEQLAALGGLGVGVMSMAGAMVAVGREKQARVDLERRHSELAKETRDRLASSEHRTNGLERWQASVDVKLSTIHEGIVELRTILSAPRSRPHD